MIVGVIDRFTEDLHFSNYEGPEFFQGGARCIFLAWVEFSV